MLGHRELDFQFSFKSNWYKSDNEHHAVWFGYTQNSFWQVFDSEHSHPFRENNYEPELIYSYRIQKDELNKYPDNFPSIFSSLSKNLGLRVTNIAVEHQSNGMSDPRSRSWWRLYAQAGFEGDLNDGDKLIVLPRIWARIDKGGNPADDNNSNITDYLGHGDLEVRFYEKDKGIVASALARVHSLQLDFGFPARNCLPFLTNMNLHVHYFTGYGESLIDYNQNHKTIGLGISLPFKQ